jgi:hypothetical protein
MHKHIFLVDVLGSSSITTMELNFQPVRTKIHYALFRNQLNVLGLVKNLVKNLVKIQLLYGNIKILKNYCFPTCLNKNNNF